MWDRFLTDRDRAHLALAGPPLAVGFGRRPAVLLIDNYREVLGDRPTPLLEAVAANPTAVGAAGWDAVAVQRELLAVARPLDLPVVHVTTAVGGNIPTWAHSILHPDERGRLRGPVERDPRLYEIVEDVAPTDREYVVTKVGPSAFAGTPLSALLTFLEVDTLIVGGESTSGCVRASVVDAATNRYRVIVVEDGVYDRTEASHAINLFDMNQKYADVLPLAEVVAHLTA